MKAKSERLRSKNRGFCFGEGGNLASYLVYGCDGLIWFCFWVGEEEGEGIGKERRNKERKGKGKGNRIGRE